MQFARIASASFLALFALLSVPAAAQEFEGEQPKLTVNESPTDLGTLAANSDGTGRVSFVNTGRAPLVISTVTAMATNVKVVSFPRQPILPGRGGEIVVKFDTTRPGTFDRVLAVGCNQGPSANIHVKATVAP